MDFQAKAVSLASKTQPVFRAKHAAVLTYKGLLLATGTNKLKTHPIMYRFGRHPEALFLHAEIDCIVRAVNKVGTDPLKHSTLYVARVLQTGSLGQSCPCEGCQRAIEAFSIPVVHWTTPEGWSNAGSG